MTGPNGAVKGVHCTDRRGPQTVLILLNKPVRVLCQFTDADGRDTLARFVSTPGVYPAGRLDFDSEGLLLLTDDGRLQARISQPRSKIRKTYWAQVEGVASDDQEQTLNMTSLVYRDDKGKTLIINRTLGQF